MWAIYYAYLWRTVCQTYVVLQFVQDESTLSEYPAYTRIWPYWSIITFFWVWDFKRFIVNQAEMQIVLDFFLNRDKVIVSHEQT